MTDLTSYLSVARGAVKIAHQIIKNALQKRNQFEQVSISEKHKLDLVTETDKEVEDALIKEISKHYPDHKFLGEETSTTEELGEEPTWIIDPIDGTNNFISNHPFFCISIAFAIKKELILAIVFNPTYDEEYTATLGGGTWLNGTQRCHVSSTQSLSDAIISTNIGPVRDEKTVSFNINNIHRLFSAPVRSVRLEGSAAWQMALVSSGRSDLFFEWGIHAWDIAAATLLIREAGGVVVHPDGSPLVLSSRRVLGGSPALIKPLSELIDTNHPHFT